MLLLTGSSGFVGRHFLRNWNSVSHSPADRLVSISRSGDGQFSNSLLDLSDELAVQRFAENIDQISTVIHLAAESRTGVCESNYELAHTGNVLPTKHLLSLAETHASHFIYISTDMVFSGISGSYLPDSQAHPINNYGRSKYEAEKLVKAYKGPWSIVRPALIYGDGIAGKNSFLDWTLKCLRNQSGQFFADEFRTPVFVDNLINLITFIHTNKLKGIYHAGGIDRLSRWNFSQQVADLWNLPLSSSMKSYLEDNGEHGCRPRDLSLNSEVSHSLVPFTPTEEALHLIKARHLQA